MLLGAGQAMEQAMPATGLGLPSPGGGIHMAGQGQYQGAGPYHPGYMQQQVSANILNININFYLNRQF
jgi:hypothetical protein